MTGPWKVSAEEEYAKDPNLKKEDVLSLKSWADALDYLPSVDEEIICHFLHASFYNVEQTKKTIEYFYTYKATMPEFFDHWDPTDKDLQEQVKNILIAAPLRKQDGEGNRIIVCKFNDTSPEKFNYAACVKWILMSCTCGLWDRGIEPGYVIVYDATGYSMGHLMRSSLSNIKNYINYGKNASPIRVVKIVFINTSPVVKKLIQLVKPFLNKELVNMMHFYTSADEYFGNFPKDMVPEDYGGTGPPLLQTHREIVKAICEAKDHLLADEKVRADINKKNGKGRKGSSSVEDSFKKLELD